MTQQTQQVFELNQLSGQEIEAIMTGLNELPAKASRTIMNKIEGQIIAQLQAAQAAAQAAEQPAEAPAKESKK